MPEINKTEVHSEEVQEIMGQIPGWIIRWGLAVVFSIFALIILGSYFFSYPEIVSVPLVITTYNTPAILEAKSGGKIDRIFVEDEQKVQVGQHVALIENATHFEDLLLLEHFINQLQSPFEWSNIVMQTSFEKTLSLGELQNQFSVFQKNWNQFRYYLEQSYLPLKIKLLDEQINKQQEIHENQLQQLHLQVKDLELTGRSYQRDSLVYEMSNLVISKAEYERSLQNYIQKQAAYKGFENNIKNSEASQLKLKETKVELQLQYEKEQDQYYLELSENLQLLQSAIEQWKQRYLLISPINGNITFTSFWNENQIIKPGERLATVVPTDEARIVAKAIIPPGSLGKVEKGQAVHIKLSGFPFMEYGMLKGKVSAISMVPEQGGFVAQIELTSGMTSSYSQQLRFIQEMDGTAEIVTQRMRLIYRLINPLKALVDKMNENN